jgi:hypothetical protein
VVGIVAIALQISRYSFPLKSSYTNNGSKPVKNIIGHYKISLEAFKSYALNITFSKANSYDSEKEESAEYCNFWKTFYFLFGPFRKERGFFSTYYTYITVFIRNAVNLTLLLLKGSKLRKGNTN